MGQHEAVGEAVGHVEMGSCVRSSTSNSFHGQTYGIGQGVHGSTGGVGEGHAGVEGAEEHSHPRTPVTPVLTRASGDSGTRQLHEQDGEGVRCSLYAKGGLWLRFL